MCVPSSRMTSKVTLASAISAQNLRLPWSPIITVTPGGSSKSALRRRRRSLVTPPPHLPHMSQPPTTLLLRRDPASKGGLQGATPRHLQLQKRWGCAKGNSWRASHAPGSDESGTRHVPTPPRYAGGPWHAGG